MTDTAHATPGPLPPPPRRSHGCLWGCLIAALVAIAAIIAAVSFGGWYLYSGFKNNATIKAVVMTINHDPVAKAVLGDNIEITGLGSSNYTTDTNTGTVENYIANLKGSKGSGTLEIHSTTPPHGQQHIDMLKLTGPDGHQYDLLNEGNGDAAPPTNSTDTPQGQGNNP